MPGMPASGMLQFISVLMLLLDIAKAVLIVFVLFRGVVLINLFIKKLKNDNKPEVLKTSSIPEQQEEQEEQEESED